MSQNIENLGKKGTRTSDMQLDKYMQSLRILKENMQLSLIDGRSLVMCTLMRKILEFLGSFADEFLVHGVDVEGKRLGIDEELVALLGRHSPIPVTYAGGVTVMADLERIKVAGMGRVDVTVGSALDIFGGNLAYKDVVAWHAQQEALIV